MVNAQKTLFPWGFNVSYEFRLVYPCLHSIFINISVFRIQWGCFSIFIFEEKNLVIYTNDIVLVWHLSVTPENGVIFGFEIFFWRGKRDMSRDAKIQFLKNLQCVSEDSLSLYYLVSSLLKSTNYCSKHVKVYIKHCSVVKTIRL